MGTTFSALPPVAPHPKLYIFRGPLRWYRPFMSIHMGTVVQCSNIEDMKVAPTLILFPKTRDDKFRAKNNSGPTKY